MKNIIEKYSIKNLGKLRKETIKREGLSYKEDYYIKREEREGKLKFFKNY